MASGGSQPAKKIQFDAGFDGIVIAENNRLAFNKYANRIDAAPEHSISAKIDPQNAIRPWKLTSFKAAFLFPSF